MQNKPDIIAQLDQAATGFANIARVLGEYYSDLIKSGIPDDLACGLVRDAQRFMLAPKPQLPQQED